MQPMIDRHIMKPAWGGRLRKRTQGRTEGRGKAVELIGQSSCFHLEVSTTRGSPSRHSGGSGSGLGKVRIAAGQPTPAYTPSADDAGKYLIFEVIPVATSGNPVGKPATAVIGPIQAASGAHGTSNE